MAAPLPRLRTLAQLLLALASPLAAAGAPLLTSAFYSDIVPPSERSAMPATSGSFRALSAPGSSEMTGIVFRTGAQRTVITSVLAPLHFGSYYVNEQRTYSGYVFALNGSSAERPESPSLGPTDGLLALALSGTSATLPYVPPGGWTTFRNFTFEVAPGSDPKARELQPLSWYALGFACSQGCVDSSDTPATYAEWDISSANSSLVGQWSVASAAGFKLFGAVANRNIVFPVFMRAPLFDVFGDVVVAPPVYGLPSQISLNWGRAPDELVVTWTDSLDTDDAGKVLYGLAPGALTSTSAAPSSSVYSTPPGSEGIFGPLPAYASGLIHRVTLTGLPNAATLYYSLGSNASGWTAEASVQTHPGVGPNIPVTMLLLADIGADCFYPETGKDCHPAAVVAAASDPAVLATINAGGIVLGDLAYANGNGSTWDEFSELFQPLGTRLSVSMNAGNHEMEDNWGSETFVSFKVRYGGMPFNSPANVDSGALFYSYNVGGLHVIALSAYSDLSASSPMTAFLRSDLAAVNRSVTPWVACAWHPPVYNSNTKHYMEHEDFRLAYEALLLEYRVNVVLVGHVHGYQRTTLVFNDSVVSEASGAGIWHFMVGMGGKELYTVWREPLSDYPWVAVRRADFFGYATLTVFNASSAALNVFCAFSTTDACQRGDVVDSFFMTNQLIANPFPPSPSPLPAPAAAAGASADDIKGAMGAGVGIGIGSLCALLVVLAVVGRSCGGGRRDKEKQRIFEFGVSRASVLA